MSDRFTLSPDIASDGWYLSFQVPHGFKDGERFYVDPSELLLRVLRENKVVTPRSRFQISMDNDKLLFYIEFRSKLHGTLFISRLEKHIAKNGGSIL